MSALAKHVVQADAVTYMTLTRNAERRKHRRHDLADQDLPVYLMVDGTPKDTAVGQLVDISAGGVRFTTVCDSISIDCEIDLHLTLPSYAGLRAFVDPMDGESFTTEWAGKLKVTRVVPGEDGRVEVAGRIVGMSEGERGLLGLYLSTQPVAA